MPENVFSFYVLPTQKERMRCASYSRTRTTFKKEQLRVLEGKFRKKRYISMPERLKMSEDLGVNQVAIKTWFQNRRMKEKRQSRENPVQ